MTPRIMFSFQINLKMIRMLKIPIYRRKRISAHPLPVHDLEEKKNGDKSNELILN